VQQQQQQQLLLQKKLETKQEQMLGLGQGLVRMLVLVRVLAVVLPPQTLAGEGMMVGVVVRLREWWQGKCWRQQEK